MIFSKILISLMLLLSGVSLQAGFFDDIKVSYYEQKGDLAYDDGKYLEAYEFFRNAAENGSGYGYYKLFVMYKQGQGVQPNKSLENQMLQKAADMKYPVAQVIFANRLLFDEPQDYNKAISLLNDAAKQEHPRAFESLYIIYKHGIGVDKNIQEAMKYYRLAKANGLQLKNPSKVSAAITKKELVRSIQNGLKKLGFYRGIVDGISGPMTRKSIENFQKFYNYPVNTNISNNILKQINNEVYK